jgi:hypothetical protein
VAEAVLRNLGLMITASSDLRDKVGRYQMEGLVANVNNVAAVVLKTLKNRATVTQDEVFRGVVLFSLVVKRLFPQDDVRVLEDCAVRLERDLPAAVVLARQRPGDAERGVLCDSTIASIERVQRVIGKAIISSPQFAPPPDVQSKTRCLCVMLLLLTVGTEFGTVRQKNREAQEAVTEANLSAWSVEQVCELFEKLGASQDDSKRLKDEGFVWY